MAVGKGSMERAAKTAGTAKKTSTSTKKTSGKTVAATETVAAAEMIVAPTEAVMQQVVYQTSSGMLERDANPNEIFGLGDAMPVYYF